MSDSVNVVHLMGTSGKDPEIRATSGGTVIASFSLAITESRKDAQGNWKNETEWVNVKCFGKTAEAIREHVRKGTKVFVEGRLTTETWDDKNTGQKRYKTVVVARYASAIPTARTFGATKESSPSNSESAQTNTFDQALKSTEIGDDDIPF